MRPKYGHWVIFEHCMPFDVSRAYDEAKGLDRPQIWTAERDVEMWRRSKATRKSSQPKCTAEGGTNMNVVTRPNLAARPARRAGCAEYLTGFGNGFETEALPGALPVGRNSPQRCAYGLYAEQLIGLAVHRAARHQRALAGSIASGRRSRMGPLRQGRCGLWRTAPAPEVDLPIAPAALGPDRRSRTTPISFLAGRAHHHHGRRRRHPGRHGRACLPDHPLDGGRVLLQRRRRDAVRAAAGRAALRAPSSASSTSSPARSPSSRAA